MLLRQHSYRMPWESNPTCLPLDHYSHNARVKGIEPESVWVYQLLLTLLVNYSISLATMLE